MDIIIRRDVDDSTITVIFAPEDTSQASVYLDAKRIGRATWDGEKLTESGAPMLPNDPWAKRACAVMAGAIRERLDVIAGGGLAPWEGVATRLRALSTEAVNALHVQVAALALATAGMHFEDDGERLYIAAKLEGSTPAVGPWSAAERAILMRVVRAMRERAATN